MAGSADEPAAADGLAQAAWELDDGNVVIAARERAYRGYRAAGDGLSAARMATWLALDAIHFRGETAVAQGWFGRAHRLLPAQPESLEHALLPLFEGQIALRVERDAVKALSMADVVIAVGTRLGSADLEVMGLALRGLALVGLGDVAEGMRLLDEASAAAMGGELDQLGSAWLPCCFLMWGCEQTRDWGRAGEWCLRVMDFCSRADWMGSPYAMCRAHYGAILLWQGDWAAAESELQRAAEMLTAQRPWFALSALASLGELRRRQGRRDEAAALFEQAQRLPAARVGRAELHLDGDDPRAAIEIVERLLDQLRPQTRLERAAALELGVRAASTAGEARRWGWAVAELTDLARMVGTDAVSGSADWATGVHAAATGDTRAAVGALERAVECFDRARGPYDAARARLDLASAFRAADRPRPAAEEAERARDAFLRLGAAPDAQRAERLLAELLGHRMSGDLTRRQIEIVKLLALGLTNGQIARQLDLSEHTVKRHVANVLTRLGLPSRAAVAAYASRAGLL